MTLVDVLSTVEDAAGGPESFAVIGAVARNAWAPPRATTDVDLAIAARPEILQAIGCALRTLGYQQVRQQQADPGEQLPDIVIFRSEATGLPQVDLLVAKTPFEEQVLRRAVRIEVGPCAVPIASPEDLIVYKLLADRPRDREDIRAVLRTQARVGRPLDWQYVEQWAAFWRITDRLERLRSRIADEP